MAIGEYLVAVCDVLGFSHLVRTNPLETVYENYLGLRRQVRSFQCMVGYKPRSEPLLIVDGAVFSDTVLLWAPAEGAMDVLPMLLCFLVGQSIGSMPLRVGVAFGKCVIDSQNDIFIGQPIIDAHQTETRQQWVGGAYHHSCQTLPGFTEWLCDHRAAVKYPVPAKEGDPLEYALDWTWAAEGDVLATLRRQEQDAPRDKDKEKWQRARTFCEIRFRSADAT
ncbi:MAG: hypothetical protein RDU83_00120 [bacterium]|nr:hypothetical protein [bacterium]